MSASQAAAPEDPRANRNRLLAALPREEYDLLRPHMERLHLEVLEVIAEANEPFTHVYFPESGIISVVSRLTEGGTVETGTVGNEGMAGLSAVLTGEPDPHTTMMQVPGEVLRVDASLVARLMEERPALRRLLHRYAQAYLFQVAQAAA